MGARNRLNGAYLTGSLLLAVAVGALTGSITVGLLAFGALTVIDFVAGNIRLSSRGR